MENYYITWIHFPLLLIFAKFPFYLNQTNNIKVSPSSSFAIFVSFKQGNICFEPTESLLDTIYSWSRSNLEHVVSQSHGIFKSSKRILTNTLWGIV